MRSPYIRQIWALPLAMLLASAVSCGGGASRNPGTGGRGGTGTAGVMGATGGTAGTGLGTGGGTIDGCLDFGPARVVGTIESTGLAELSGLVASRAHPGVLYAHADAGSAARFFAIDTAGKTLGEFVVADAGSVDWEDISVGSDPGGATFVFIGDIGDNSARDGMGDPRAQIQVYKVPEPVVTPGQAAVQQTLTGTQMWRFSYPDRPHDAETLMIDSMTGDLVIITREEDGNSSIFRAPPLVGTPPGVPAVLEKITNVQFGVAGTATARVSAGDMSPKGDRIIVRTQTSILMWARIPGPSLAPTFAEGPRYLPQHSQPQAEGITFSADGGSWFSAGEGEAAIYQGSSTCP